MIAPAIVKTALVVGAVVGAVEAAAIAVVSQTTSVTIDPTFWVALFGFLTAAVTAFFAYKTKQKSEEIAAKVDGAATASAAEMADLRTEIQRLNEDRLARADAAPAPVSGPASSAPSASDVPAAPTGTPIPVVITDTEKTVPVDVILKQEP